VRNFPLPVIEDELVLGYGDNIRLDTNTFADLMFSHEFSAKYKAFICTYRGSIFKTLVFLFSLRVLFFAINIPFYQSILSITISVSCILLLLPCFYSKLSMLTLAQCDVLYIILNIFIAHSMKYFMTIRHSENNTWIYLIDRVLLIPFHIATNIFIDSIPTELLTNKNRKILFLFYLLWPLVYYPVHAYMHFKHPYDTNFMGVKISPSKLHLTSAATLVLWNLKLCYYCFMKPSSLIVLSRNPMVKRKFDRRLQRALQ